MAHDSRLDPIGPSPDQRMEAVRAAADAQVARLKDDWKLQLAEPLPAPEGRTAEQAVVEAARAVVATFAVLEVRGVNIAAPGTVLGDTLAALRAALDRSLSTEGEARG